MRTLLVASLLLSPVLYSASAAASQSKTDAPGVTQDLRVSTGITSVSFDAASIHLAPSPMDQALPSQAEVTLALNVDANGYAQDVRVVQSVNADLDARVVAAVRQTHFRPATLDHQPISREINLVVRVQR